MKDFKLTFWKGLMIFVVAYAIFFFMFAAADAVFFSPDFSPGVGGVAQAFSFNSLAIMFLVSILAIFVVAAVLYYIIVSI